MIILAQKLSCFILFCFSAHVCPAYSCVLEKWFCVEFAKCWNATWPTRLWTLVWIKILLVFIVPMALAFIALPKNLTFLQIRHLLADLCLSSRSELPLEFSTVGSWWFLEVRDDLPDYDGFWCKIFLSFIYFIYLCFVFLTAFDSAHIWLWGTIWGATDIWDGPHALAPVSPWSSHNIC